jgi:tetratricopeptide (TPR) repeat protein
MSEEDVSVKKLSHLQQKNLTPADKLRELLHDLDNRHTLVSQMTSTQVLGLLRDLDHIYHTFAELETSQLDLSAEKGLFTELQGHLKRQIKPLLKVLGGAAALHDYSPAKPSPQQWWWHADEIVAKQQSAWQRQVLIIGMVIAVIFAAVFLALNTVFAPDPQVLARYEIERTTFSAIDAEKFDEALMGIEEGLKKFPQDEGFWLTKGVLQDILKQPAATQTFQQAEKIINSPFNFHLGRGQLYLRVNLPEKAEVDLRAALALNEKVSLAWLLLGQALEAQSKKVEASLAYEKAGSLALDNGESEIVVSARMALMRLGALNIPGGTP